MKKIYFTTIISLLLTSCSISNLSLKHKKEDNSKYKILSNEGTICLQRVSRNTLKATYLPLNSTCKSSSQYSWQMNDINLKSNNSTVAIETYSMYKKSNSQIATADCAGAGVKVKTVKTANTPIYIKWGETNIATLNSIGEKSCFRRIGKEVKRVDRAL